MIKLTLTTFIVNEYIFKSTPTVLLQKSSEMKNKLLYPPLLSSRKVSEEQNSSLKESEAERTGKV